MQLHNKLVSLIVSLVLALSVLAALNFSLSWAVGDNDRFTPLTNADGIRLIGRPAINDDGTRIVFYSDIDFLGQGIPEEQYEIWLYDTTTMTVTRLTTAAGIGDRRSFFPVINGNGTQIVFESNADFLEQGIPDNRGEIWLYDTTTMTLTRITAANSGDRRGSSPAISGDGTKIAFASNADFLNQGSTHTRRELWLYDTTTMTFTRITTTTEGRSLYQPSINADGKRIAFVYGTKYIDQAGTTRHRQEIWLYDTTTMTLTQLTTSVGSGFRDSTNPDISADGTKIVFNSNADFFNQGIGEYNFEVWLYDTTTMTLTRITPNTSLEFGGSGSPTISNDNTKIAFMSAANFLSPTAEPHPEIWLYDTNAMTFTRLTHTDMHYLGHHSPAISGDGNRVTFVSDVDFLNGNVSTGQYEVWLYDLAAD